MLKIHQCQTYTENRAAINSEEANKLNPSSKVQENKNGTSRYHCKRSVRLPPPSSPHINRDLKKVDLCHIQPAKKMRNNIITTFLQQILSNRLLLVIIIGLKK